MAADIILYNVDYVPIGKDQQQHLEMARDIAGIFNRTYGDTFIIPEAKIDERVMIVPGTDGRKMSKSYNNFINIFLTEKELKKQVMSIITDSTPLEQPKDPNSCNVFKLYALLASAEQQEELRKNYVEGNFGYGHAKQALLDLMLDKFKAEREKYNYYMHNIPELEGQLQQGAQKARIVARDVLRKVRLKLGYIN
jgi:tryptophanyl-tRNA synthetase